jgi:hypothetical protein
MTRHPDELANTEVGRRQRGEDDSPEVEGHRYRFEPEEPGKRQRGEDMDEGDEGEAARPR